MFKNRILQLMLIILIAITLIVGALFFFLYFLNKDDALSEGTGSETVVQKSATEIRDSTVFLNDVLANLAQNEGVVKISFAFELENEEAKAEMELLNFKVQDIVNQTLMETKPEDLQTAEGVDELKTKLLNRINPILTKGKLLQVYITNKVVN